MLRSLCTFVLATPVLATPVLAPSADAQDPAPPAEHAPGLPGSFRRITAARPDGSEATLYVGDFHPDGWPTRPLLVWVEGSGAQSLFYRLEDETLANGMFGLLARHAGADFHVAAIEKRGVALGERGAYGTAAEASAEYQRHATLEARAADVRLLISTLLEDPSVDPNQVLLVGHSEGADVAALVAGRDERVTHAAILSGGGPPQFFDFFLMRRAALEESGAAPETIAAAMRTLEDEVRRIVADPENESAMYLGHAYKRWSSFATRGSADALVGARARLFLAHGSADESVPIESFDYLVTRLLCAGRTDVTIRRYPGRDHSFIPVGAEPGHEGFLEVFDAILEWSLAD